MQNEMAKTNRRSLIVEEEEPLPISNINPKCYPGIILGPKAVENENVFHIIDNLLALWKAFRYVGIKENNIPRFAGLFAKLFGRTDVQLTYLTNLPPLTKPITDYSTIIEIFCQSRTLSQKCNLQHTCITKDI